MNSQVVESGQAAELGRAEAGELVVARLTVDN